MSEVIYASEDKLELKSGVVLDFVKLGTFLNAYLELQDRIIIHVFHDIERRAPTFNIFRNIFCYAKSDGRQLWQIEQAYDHRTHEPLEEVYKYIKIHILQTDGSYEDASEAFECADGVIGERYLKPFRPGKDRLSTMTLSQFPNEYWIDYETGKVEWFAIHQKI